MRANFRAVLMLVLVALMSAGAAQTTPPESKGAAPLEVVNFEWKYQGYASAETVLNESDTINMKTKRGVVYVFKYTARVSLRNPTEKTVKAVEWNYVFVDPESGKELKRYKILSRQQILPRETRALVKDIFFELKENTRHLSTGRQKVQLARIEYTDGSVWRA